ncbi:NF-kappa-B inhibitor epsilon [Bufo bufo]|uniref:NF-kappa-B inhibitor epsilon n=1 Tax=Bufo bufo TaxID=8384 RepID=UPI001ABE9994|nr:NF-kappa-B inhibitor epsilon [Bufo bufo]
MAQDWGAKKLGPPPEDVRYDSGLADSVQSLQEEAVLRLPSASDDGPPKSGAASRLPLGDAADKVSDVQDLERVDSTYGSVSLTESLPLTCLPPSGAPETGSQDTEQLDSLTYLSEEGDTLPAPLHLFSASDLVSFLLAGWPLDCGPHHLLHLFQLLALLPFDDLKISGKPVVTSA